MAEISVVEFVLGFIVGAVMAGFVKAWIEDVRKSKYEYKQARRLDAQHHAMNRLGAEGWKLIDVRHLDGEPSWADELLFMREIPDQEKSDG